MQIKCEICKGTNIIKKDGIYECQNCGIKYTANEILDIYKKTNSGKTNSKVSIKSGDEIVFGSFPQQSLETPEPIEWIVLSSINNIKALLLCKKGIMGIEFSRDYSDVTWENSYIRAWLNRYFLFKAFTNEERSAIELSYISNLNPQGGYFASGGRDTQDMVFSLSYEQAFLEYFTNKMDKERQCVMTNYAHVNGVEIGIDSNEYYRKIYSDINGDYLCAWWLRTPASCLRGNDICTVHHSGCLIPQPLDDTQNNICVRPAMWINLAVYNRICNRSN